MQRILSGVRPTGIIHLGNYLGAIQQWHTHLSKPETDFLFCIVDLHALTTLESSDHVYEQSHLMAATYLACGLSPDQCHIFKQSAVPAHSELSWLLSCITPMGWLNRMTQFKEKAGSQRDQAHLGLYAYPVMMAADILVYETTHVPVGEDQKQHVELARDIAGLFNRRFSDIFPLPQPVIEGAATRVMSLRDGTKKMSKSDPSDYSRIHLNDDADTLARKIKKAKTDTEPLAGSLDAMKHRPEACNLINILAALTQRTPAQICLDFEGKVFSTLKNDIIDALHAVILPIGHEINHLMNDRVHLDAVLRDGAQYANTLANATLSKVHHAMGITQDPAHLIS